MVQLVAVTGAERSAEPLGGSSMSTQQGDSTAFGRPLLRAGPPKSCRSSHGMSSQSSGATPLVRCR